MVGFGGQHAGPPRSSRADGAARAEADAESAASARWPGSSSASGSLRVLLCDVAHNVIGTGECELPEGYTSAAGLALAAARKLTEEALAAAGVTRDALVGAGVSLPGPVRRHPDVVKPSGVLPGWHGVTGDDIAAALGVAGEHRQ